MAKKNNQEKPTFNSYWIYGLIISILIGMSMFGGNSKWQNLKKTDISNFEKFLMNGDVEEVVVTASLTNQTVSDLEDPLHVVEGDDITSGGIQSLGETLDELLGVHTADFGAAVGQPVIRGMSGSRVRVLENGVVVRDVAALGPDHINDVNLLNSQQIEVVKGPSSLLYANCGAGGVINVDDKHRLKSIKYLSLIHI